MNQNDLLNYELKYAGDNVVLDLVRALREAYRQITKLPEREADLVDENRRMTDKILVQGAELRQTRESLQHEKLEKIRMRDELQAIREQAQFREDDHA